MRANESSWSCEERHFSDAVINVVFREGEVVVSFESELTKMSFSLVIVLQAKSRCVLCTSNGTTVIEGDLQVGWERIKVLH